MIPTPVDYQRDASAGLNDPGWWLFFLEPDYAYPVGYFVPDEGQYKPSDPSKAPLSTLSNLPHVPTPGPVNYAAQAFYNAMQGGPSYPETG